jgi:hypothetical protein
MHLAMAGALGSSHIPANWKVGIWVDEEIKGFQIEYRELKRVGR